jgi:formyl-CoA transferase/succinyl-CoA--D-citramalate CoA-transferase
MADPHFLSREMLVQLDDPELCSVTVPGIVPKLSRTKGKIEYPGQPVGAHSITILKEFLGLSDTEIALLIKDGTVKSHEE